MTSSVALKDMLNSFKENGGSFSDCVAFFGVDKEQNGFAIRAEEKYGKEGSVEIDQQTVVSENDDGAYVLAWLFVEK